jgi:hypothetical protein
MTSEQIYGAIRERVWKRLSSAKLVWCRINAYNTLQVHIEAEERASVLMRDPQRRDEIAIIVKLPVRSQCEEDHRDR